MHDSPVTDTHIVTNGGCGLIPCTMNNGTILHIDPMTYPNGIYVPANHCLKPNAAIIAHDDISDNGCIFS
jgi:hypothetical protein